MKQPEASEELTLYGERRDGWLRAGLEGRWVAICGRETFGFFSTQSEAYAQSARHFADRTFLLMQVHSRSQGEPDVPPLSAEKRQPPKP